MRETYPVNFLVVDDDDDHAEIVSHHLRREAGPSNVTIHRVCDGVEAMDFLHQRGDVESQPRPDIVLLDLNMPRMNGHEVLEQIKGNADLKRIPVIILTTSSAESDLCRAYDRYANSYLVKPMEFASFKELVRELCDYWRQWNVACS